MAKFVIHSKDVEEQVEVLLGKMLKNIHELKEGIKDLTFEPPKLHDALPIYDPLAEQHPFFEGSSKKSRAEALAKVTEDAYSHGFYTERGWLNAIRVLVQRGFSNEQIDQLMRSKHTRWAGDCADRHDRKYNSADLVKRYLDVSFGSRKFKDGTKIYDTTGHNKTGARIFYPSDYRKLGFTDDGCVSSDL
jgi:hypothetical protein